MGSSVFWLQKGMDMGDIKVKVIFADGEEREVTELEELTEEDLKGDEYEAMTVETLLEDRFNLTFDEGGEPIALINGEPGSFKHEIEEDDVFEFPELEGPAE